MLFRQLFDRESCTYTYLIACVQSNEAILIDSVKSHAEQYLQYLTELNLKLVLAMDTHVHADHITGMGMLQKLTGCDIAMGEHAKVVGASIRLQDGDALEVGHVQGKVFYTPGHTDDSYCYLFNDCVLTGDTLMIRGSGRTDFQHGDSGAQYKSITERLFTLPDETLVYPGHDYNGMTVSTIGEEKQWNPRLQVNSAKEYADIMNNLNLAKPKLIDVAVPANRRCGLDE